MEDTARIGRKLQRVEGILPRNQRRKECGFTASGSPVVDLGDRLGREIWWKSRFLMKDKGRIGKEISNQWLGLK